MYTQTQTVIMLRSIHRGASISIGSGPIMPTFIGPADPTAGRRRQADALLDSQLSIISDFLRGL